MILGKEDELLEKLQKCVGRLDTKPAEFGLETRERSTRVSDRPSIKPANHDRSSYYATERQSQRINSFQ